jgi:hypothetical protein
MSDQPTPLTDEAIRAADGQWTFLVRDLCRNLERQLAAATEEREQMGKQAHANACEAMRYRRQLAEARTALEKFDGCFDCHECTGTAEEAVARIDERGTA